MRKRKARSGSTGACLEEIDIGTNRAVVPLEQDQFAWIWEGITQIQAIAKANMIQNPVRNPTFLAELPDKRETQPGLREHLFQTDVNRDGRYLTPPTAMGFVGDYRIPETGSGACHSLFLAKKQPHDLASTNAGARRRN